jgi:mono/diheme cytochrome c family protein
MKLVKFCLVLIAISAFFLACTDSGKNEAVENVNKAVNNEQSPVTPTKPVETVSGLDIYKEHCAKCHKEDGKGGKVEILGKQLKAENLTTPKMADEPDDEYIKVMVEGIPDEGMPSFKDVLSKDEMNEVVKYIRTEFQGKK